MKNYTDLKIYQQAYELAVQVHHLSFKHPRYVVYESGSQIRRSSKSIAANIVEGSGRNKYQHKYLRFIVIAHASCDETISHLELIIKTHRNIESDLRKHLLTEYDLLGSRIIAFKQTLFRSL
jgi:four helix bundle protein